MQAVVVAGGSGKRLGSDLPKQFLILKDKPIILRTIETFADFSEDLEIIIPVNPQYRDTLVNILKQFKHKNYIKIVDGGHTRFHSVKNGLKEVVENSVVFIQDSVRCLTSKELIKRCLCETIKHKNAIPALKIRDSLRIITNERNKNLNRENVRLTQTPQTFISNTLIKAFEQDYNTNFTDEASVVESLGIKINLIEGEETNIKITYSDDLHMAEFILNKLG